MLRFLIIVILVLAGTSLVSKADEKDVLNPGWRRLQLISGGKVAPGWRQIGWGSFAVEDGALRTECDERGMGLLLYSKEKFGDCRIRVIYRVQHARSNAGVFVRVDDGILDRLEEKAPAIERDDDGDLSGNELRKLMQASERELGAWYPVHHGYEIQICDSGVPFNRTGAVYSLSNAAPLPEKSSDWRTMIITLRGERIEVQVDGKPISFFDPAAKDVPAERDWYEPRREPRRPAHGYLGLQNHDPGDVVYFKEIAVGPLPDQRSR